jgi:hypothetical protein
MNMRAQKVPVRSDGGVAVTTAASRDVGVAVSASACPPPMPTPGASAAFLTVR